MVVGLEGTRSYGIALARVLPQHRNARDEASLLGLELPDADKDLEVDLHVTAGQVGRTQSSSSRKLSGIPPTRTDRAKPGMSTPPSASV